MEHTIYLVGQISANDERTYQWRRNFSKRLYDVVSYDKEHVDSPATYSINHFDDHIHRKSLKLEHDITVINPCSNMFNQVTLEKNNGDPKRSIVYKQKGINVLPRKDKVFVDKSDIIVANMTSYDPLKPFIGSMFELAWAMADPSKTIIGVFDGDPKNDLNYKHPFVQGVVNVWVKSEYDAADMIRFFFID